MKMVLDIIIIISIQAYGQFGQEPESSQATSMALVRCILGKFLGVVCQVLDMWKKTKMWTEIMTHTSLCILSIFCILKYTQRDNKTTLCSGNKRLTEWHTSYEVLKASTDEQCSATSVWKHLQTHWRSFIEEWCKLLPHACIHHLLQVFTTN